MEEDKSSELKYAVEDSLRSVEEKDTDHDRLLKQGRQLRNAIRDKRREAKTQENRHLAGMYGAADNLASAVLYVLGQSQDISNIDAETQQEGVDSSAAREDFVNRIRLALNNLGLHGDAVQEVLKKKGDI